MSACSGDTKMHDADGAAAYMDRFLRDICVNFFLAGRDTSSVALASCFFLLSKNPGVEAKMVEEVEGIIAEQGGQGGAGVPAGGGEANGIPPHHALRGTPSVHLGQPHRGMYESCTYIHAHGTPKPGSEAAMAWRPSVLESMEMPPWPKAVGYSQSSDLRSWSQSSRCHLYHCLRLQGYRLIWRLCFWSELI